MAISICQKQNFYFLDLFKIESVVLLEVNTHTKLAKVFRFLPG